MKITRITAPRENRKTRVAVYCRVSTDKDTQEDSLEMQREAFLSLIALSRTGSPLACTRTSSQDSAPRSGRSSWR